MLNIYFEDVLEAEKDKYIYNTAVYFKNTYRDRWITLPLSIEMIRDVDKSEVISETQIKCPVFGMMSSVQLSGGIKTLILTTNDQNHIFNASTCGDNCAK